MALPADYDRDLWCDPVMFAGLEGSALARGDGCYRDLFREDGFAKPKAALMEIPWCREKIEREEAERAEWRERYAQKMRPKHWQDTQPKRYYGA